jgi:hypothetical protein
LVQDRRSNPRHDAPPGGIAAQRIYIPPAGEERFVKDELVLEFVGVFPPGGIAQVLGRQGLVQLESQYFALTNSTIVRARITDGRPVRVALQGLGPETTLRFGQPNFLFLGSQQQVTLRRRPRRRRQRWRPRRRSRRSAIRRNTRSASFASARRIRLPPASGCWSR